MRARRLRVLRGSGAAFVATTIAATAHTVSGGGAPPAWLLLAVIILATPIAATLIGARPSAWRLTAAVAAAQVLLHTAFAAIGTDAPAALHGHSHDLISLAAVAAPGAASMTAGHLIAAALTIALLATGERMLTALARGIRRHLRVPSVTVRPIAAVVRQDFAHPRPHSALVLTSVSRRGPPAFAR